MSSWSVSIRWPVLAHSVVIAVPGAQPVGVGAAWQVYEAVSGAPLAVLEVAAVLQEPPAVVGLRVRELAVAGLVQVGPTVEPLSRDAGDVLNALGAGETDASVEWGRASAHVVVLGAQARSFLSALGPTSRVPGGTPGGDAWVHTRRIDVGGRVTAAVFIGAETGGAPGAVWEQMRSGALAVVIADDTALVEIVDALDRAHAVVPRVVGSPNEPWGTLRALAPPQSRLYGRREAA